MENFRVAVDQCSLIDVGYVGSKYMWFRGTNRKKRIKERLDRFFVNKIFLAKVKEVRSYHLNFHASDHRPILAHIITS